MGGGLLMHPNGDQNGPLENRSKNCFLHLEIMLQCFGANVEGLWHRLVCPGNQWKNLRPQAPKSEILDFFKLIFLTGGQEDMRS